jgi:hypothetical protein
MVGRSHPEKSLYQARFPHKVEVPSPPTGLGRRLDKMVEWCRSRFAGTAHRWGVYGATFYFRDAADAAAFRDTFLEPFDRLPRPGSVEAIERGCTCDPEKNFHGAGQLQADGQTLWHAHHGCKLHGIDFALGEVRAGRADVLHAEPGTEDDEDEQKPS